MNPALKARIKQLMKRVFVIGLSSALGLPLLAYAVDSFVFRYRVATNRQPLGQIIVTSYDAVAQKNGKTEFPLQSPEPQTCVNALFPPAGYVPCWYLQRHTSGAPISNRNYANHCLFNQLQGHQAPHSSHLIN